MGLRNKCLFSPNAIETRHYCSDLRFRCFTFLTGQFKGANVVILLPKDFQCFIKKELWLNFGLCLSVWVYVTAVVLNYLVVDLKFGIVGGLSYSHVPQLKELFSPKTITANIYKNDKHVRCIMFWIRNHWRASSTCT